MSGDKLLQCSMNISNIYEKLCRVDPMLYHTLRDSDWTVEWICQCSLNSISKVHLMGQIFVKGQEIAKYYLLRKSFPGTWLFIFNLTHIVGNNLQLILNLLINNKRILHILLSQNFQFSIAVPAIGRRRFNIVLDMLKMKEILFDCWNWKYLTL